MDSWRLCSTPETLVLQLLQKRGGPTQRDSLLASDRSKSSRPWREPGECRVPSRDLCRRRNMKPNSTALHTTTGLIAALLLPLQLTGQEAGTQDAIHAPPRYSIEDLGDLGGGFSAASGLNNEGVVDGTSAVKSALPQGEFHAFRWRDGVMTDLGTLGGFNSNAQDQPNSSGTITGMAETATPDPNGEDFCFGGTNLICVPYVWKKGVISPLPLPGGNNGVAFQANNRGDIVGAAESAVPDPTCQPPFFLRLNAVIWEKDHLRVLPPLSGDTN